VTEARAPEPPEKVLARVLTDALRMHAVDNPYPEPGYERMIVPADADSVLAALHRAGYRIVPESPAPDEEVDQFSPPGVVAQWALGAVPESEVGLDAAWKAAEAALPEGMSLVLRRSGVTPHYWTAEVQDGRGKTWETIAEELSWADANAALLALAARLSSRRSEGPGR